MKEIPAGSERPKDSDKLGYKFLLDSLRDQLLKPREIEENAVPGVSDSPFPTVPVRVDFPDGKKYFRIGEVAEIIGVESYVLRYWEGEFSAIRPKKSRSGQRIYDRRDVHFLATVHYLLHVEKFSLEGAKRKFSDLRKAARAQPAVPAEPVIRVQVLQDLRKDVCALIEMLEDGPVL